MTSITEPPITQAIRRAAVRATLAPSVHNTQPWRLVVHPNGLDVYADWNRRLAVLDPVGRQLMVSCGCAVFNARAAIASTGYQAVVERFPDPAQSELVARLSLTARPAAGRDPIAVLDSVIELRHTNRRRFAEDPVPPDVIDLLINAAATEGAKLMSITRPEHRQATARLSQQADRLENADPAYRAELRSWTTGDPHRLDGVPAMAVPHVDAGANDDLPIRDFDTHGVGWLPVETHSSVDQCLLLLGTQQDTPAAWLRAGEALERVLLEITRLGYAASPMTQVVEMASTNALLRHELQLTMYPHVLLRVGRAPATPATRRRRLVDVLRNAD